MHNGPHEGGNASYPVSWDGRKGTKVTSFMTVPELPSQIDQSITYYLWTDIFFGDASLGRMNQFVPQLILGSALDGSSGPPKYQPHWGFHSTWVFAAHYFFEIFNSTSNSSEAHAAYGDFHPAYPGETLYTIFELSMPSSEMDTLGEKSPTWSLTMGVLNDPNRVSVLTVGRPYMGMGIHWPIPSISWTESPFHHMCVNACWVRTKSRKKWLLTLGRLFQMCMAIMAKALDPPVGADEAGCAS